MHQSSLKKVWGFRDKYLGDKAQQPLVILDLGSMDVNGTYHECFNAPVWQYSGLDLEPGNNVDIVLNDPYCWREVKSASVDVFVSGQTFEHIEFFWITMLEIARVLKPGGLCCLIAPSGGPEHRYPVDCWRFYPDGFASLARWARLEILEVTTQWEKDPAFNDCSNNWHDTMMVARKITGPGFRRWLQSARRFVIHRALIFRL